MDHCADGGLVENHIVLQDMFENFVHVALKSSLLLYGGGAIDSAGAPKSNQKSFFNTPTNFPATLLTIMLSTFPTAFTLPINC